MNVTGITLNKLIEEFQQISDAHLMLEDFKYGNFLKIYQSNTLSYKALLMNCNNASVDQNWVILQIELMVMDKVFKDLEDRDDVESDCLEILQDIFSVVSYSNRWQSFSRVSQSSPMRKFYNKGEDQVTGWAMQFTLNVKRKNGICDLPIDSYDYDGDYAPFCAGVRIFEDDILIEVTPSGGKYSYSTAPASPTLKYNMPQPTWQTSYDTYDEGWHYTNATYSNPITSSDKVVTLDPDDWYKISDDIGSLGHNYRFINENGDYYNSDDQTYRLANGTLSDRATVFQTTFYAIDRWTGLGWYLVRGGSMNYATALTTIEGATAVGFSDWHMPFRKQFDSILNPTLVQATYATESPIFDIQLTQHICTPNGSSPTTQHHQYNTVNGYTVNRAKTSSDATSLVRKHF